MDTLYIYSFVTEGVTTTYRSPRYLIHEPCYKCISDIDTELFRDRMKEKLFTYTFYKKSRKNLVKIAKSGKKNR